MAVTLQLLAAIKECAQPQRLAMAVLLNVQPTVLSLEMDAPLTLLAALETNAFHQVYAQTYRLVLLHLALYQDVLLTTPVASMVCVLLKKLAQCLLSLPAHRMELLQAIAVLLVALVALMECALPRKHALA